MRVAEVWGSTCAPFLFATAGGVLQQCATFATNNEGGVAAEGSGHWKEAAEYR